MGTLIATGDFYTDAIGLALDVLVPNFSFIIKSLKEIREKNRMERIVMKKSSQIKNGSKVSDKMYSTIFNESDGLTLLEIDLISTAIRTNNWINYAIYYMTCDDATLLKTDKKSRELVNAICEIAGFGKIYAGSDSANLFEYDITNKNRKPGSKFLLIVDELKAKIADPDFVQAMYLRKRKLEALAGRLLEANSIYGGDFRKDSDGMMHPIFFSNTPINYDIGEKKGDGIDDILFNKLENSLRIPGLIIDDKYRYERDQSTGLIRLIIQRPNSYGAIENFLIDDGTLMGGSKLSILGTFMRTDGISDTVFVDINKHPEIVFNILNHSFYNMDVDEVNAALADMLTPMVYNVFDFSDTAWFDYLNDLEKSSLNKNLVTIIDFMRRDPNMVYLPRMRFSSYRDPDNFIVISDKQVKSPLKDNAITSPEICEGLSFDVSEGGITQYFGNVANMRTVGEI